MNQPLTADYLEQLQRGMEHGKALKLPPLTHEIRNVLLIGQGSSGITTRLVQSVVAEEIQVPVMCLNSNQIPAFVNVHTLAIAVVENETTKSITILLMQAMERNATVVCITTQSAITPTQNIILLPIPTDFAPQFSAIGYTITQLLFLLNYYQLISNSFTAQLQGAIELIDKREYFIQDGAENLALGLKNKWPILYGDAKTEFILQWFKYQLNRISKQQAHVNVFPEIAYAEIESWKHPESLLREAMIVMVTTKFDHPQTKIQTEAARSVMIPQSGGISEVMLTYGESLLEQLLYAIHLFDWTAYFLARENGEA